MAKKLISCFILFFLLWGTFSGAASAENKKSESDDSTETEVITLSEAKDMAQEMGPDIKREEIEQKLLEEQLAEHAGYYDSEAMREDLDDLEESIEEWEAEVADQEEHIAALEEEKEELEEDEPELEEIQEKLEQAREEKEELKDELTELRKGRSELLVRYRSAKAMEDRAPVDIDELRTGVDLSRDMLEIMPSIIDYSVENTYYSILTLQQQEDMLLETLSYQEELLNIARLRYEQGLATPTEVSQSEEEMRENSQSLEDLREHKNSLRRSLKKLIGLPLDDTIVLENKKPSLPDVDKLLEEEPALKESVEYQRAEEDLESAIRDLEDTSPYDRREYRIAELEVEEAELELEETLKELQSNYEEAKEQLVLAAEEYENEKFALQEAERRLNNSRHKYEAGTLSGVEFRGEKLEVLEKELSYYQARTDFHLQEQAYLLSLDGIKVEEH